MRSSRELLIEALKYLKDHPGSTAKTIAGGIGERDARYVFKVLDNAAYDGYCQRWRIGSSAWHWDIEPNGVSAIGGEQS